MTTKTNFNIVCNSALASSFTGNIYNANYYINLSSLIDDEIEDYKKKYKITFRMKTASSANILSTQSYLCESYIHSRVYNQENPQQKITFEYVMLHNINDKEENALELVKLIKKYNLNCKVNLIPFNKWNGCEYETSNITQTKKFQEILKKNDLISTIRKTRGDDVLAACGQLKSTSERVKKSSLKE